MDNTHYFVDIELETYNICPNKLEEKLRLTIKRKIPKVIIVVHLGGYPCDMKRLSQIAKKYSIRLIEDASHAFGTKYLKSNIGSCKYSEAAIFSFHAIKNITTGEGGAITTKSKKIYNNLLLQRENGIYKDKRLRDKLGEWFYDQKELGHNFRLTDLQSALGISQLLKIKRFIKKKNKIFDFYQKKLDINKFILPKKDTKNISSSKHIFIVRVTKGNKINLIKYLKKYGVNCSFHYIPIYKHSFYRNLKIKKLKNSEVYYKTGLSIPFYYDLSLKMQKKVINLMNNYK